MRGLILLLGSLAGVGCAGGGIHVYDGGVDRLHQVAVSHFIIQRCRNVVVDRAILKPPGEYYLAPPSPEALATGAAKPGDLVIVEERDAQLHDIDNKWTDEHGFIHYFGWGPQAGVELILPKKRTKDDTGAAGSLNVYGFTKDATIPLQIEVDAKGVGRPTSKVVMVCELDLLT